MYAAGKAGQVAGDSKQRCLHEAGIDSAEDCLGGEVQRWCCSAGGSADNLGVV